MYYSSHKADDDFQHSSNALKFGQDHFISIRSDKSLIVGAVVRGFYCAIKGISRESSDDASVIF